MNHKNKSVGDSGLKKKKKIEWVSCPVSLRNGCHVGGILAYSLSLYLCFCFPSSATQRVPAASPSAHSISTTTPDRTRFPRGSSSRSTFHGEQLRERRNATYNGPPASPSHETGAFAHARRGTSTGIISKITSKFVRRLVPRFLREKKKKKKVPSL